MNTLEIAVSFVHIADQTGLSGDDDFDRNEELIDQALDDAISEEFYTEIAEQNWDVSLSAQNFDSIEAWDDAGNQIDPMPWAYRVAKAITHAFNRIRRGAVSA